MSRRTRWSLLAALLLAVPACGESEIGEECDTAGSQDDCEGGALCTNEGGGAVCRALCAEQDDCPPGHACNGVSGTNLKSCQPD